MGILSKIELQKRIIFGEILIYKTIQDDKRFPETFAVLKEQLDKIVDLFPKEDKIIWRNYCKALESDPRLLLVRKSAIENCAKDIFLDKEPNEIENKISALIGTDKENRKLEDTFKVSAKEKNTWIYPIFIDDVEYVDFKAANYDLRLGENVYVTTEKIPKKLNIAGKDVVSIEPGEFGILMTYEYLFVPPDLMGYISVRLTHKQKGLVNISGFHVDPGFYGRLMFSVFNAGPKDVPLRYKDEVFMIMFNELSGEKAKCSSSRWGGMENIPVETLSGLTGSSVSVRNLDERIRRLEVLLPIVITLFGSLLVAFIGWILSHPL